MVFILIILWVLVIHARTRENIKRDNDYYRRGYPILKRQPQKRQLRWVKLPNGNYGYRWEL